MGEPHRLQLYASPPIGFVREGNLLRKDPDVRVRTAIETVFARFREGGSGLQAARLLRAEGVRLPSRPRNAEAVTWKDTTYSRVMEILRNPAMGGAYAYGKGRRGYRDDGALLAPQERWRVLKPDHHEGYVPWTVWLEVQETLARNSTRRDRKRGAAREGAALLQGLAVCGRCGRSIQVRYNKGRSYYCNWRTVELGQSRSCFSVGGIGIDAVVARHFLERLSPAGTEAARAAEQAVSEREEAALRSCRLELEQCRYEASLAERRYRRVDPDNRLIAATLEREWEAALAALERAEFALKTARERQPKAPPPGYFADLGASLERVWHAPTTTSRDHKRLLACLVEEITLQVVEDDQTEVVIHWRGGETDAFEVPRQRRKPVRQVDDMDTVEWVRRLAPVYPDVQIARILNQEHFFVPLPSPSHTSRVSVGAGGGVNNPGSSDPSAPSGRSTPDGGVFGPTRARVSDGALRRPCFCDDARGIRRWARSGPRRAPPAHGRRSVGWPRAGSGSVRRSARWRWPRWSGRRDCAAGDARRPGNGLRRR